MMPIANICHGVHGPCEKRMFDASIAALQKQKSTAMILITHDLAVVAENCQNVAIVYAGEIVEYGSIAQVYSRPMHPYTEGLFASIPDTSTKVERLRPIFGAPPDPTALPAGCKFRERCPYAQEACREAVPTVTLPDGHRFKCIRREAQQLGKFLPELYAEYSGKPDDAD